MRHSLGFLLLENRVCQVCPWALHDAEHAGSAQTAQGNSSALSRNCSVCLQIMQARPPALSEIAPHIPGSVTDFTHQALRQPQVLGASTLLLRLVWLDFTPGLYELESTGWGGGLQPLRAQSQSPHHHSLLINAHNSRWCGGTDLDGQHWVGWEMAETGGPQILG